MRQLGTEEKAALLLTPIDDDDDDGIDQSSKIHHDQFTTVSKRPKSYYRTRTNSSHPVLVFVLILSAFIFGCLSGVVIMIYRISQDAERSTNSNDFNRIDLSIQSKLSQTITKNNFLHLNFSTESLNESANKLEQTWKMYPKVFNQVKQISYDLTLTKYSPSNQWSGIQLIDEKKDKELTNFNLLSTDEYLTYSSLIKSGQFDGKFVCYVNFGRDEDFAYFFQQNAIQFENHRQTIVFMRRNATIISQTEQIRQAIRYEFGGLVLFDDDNDHQQQQQSQTTNRQSIVDQWKRFSKNSKFLEDFSIDNDQQIVLLILSNSDVENIFSAIPSDSNQWPKIPDQWYSKPTALKLGGQIQEYKLRMNSYIQEIPVQLPVIIGQVQGQIEPEKFIIVGYQLGQKQQEAIVNEIIRAFNVQITNGWKPRRSMLFCAWSDLTSDHFTVERWINENKDFIESNLIGYFDLADGIQGNTTLNLHGSPLFEQIASRTADFVVSPLIHDHVCHHRQTHIHRKRRHDDHDQHSQMTSKNEQTTDDCQPHKLLDEWLKTTKTCFQSNQTYPIVQLIDSHSTASIFQLKYGIPSLTIEMTDLQFVDNQTFYSQKLRSTYSNDIQPEILVSYTQYLTELIRQFIDQPLIPFNLTNYADLIDEQTSEYFAHFDRSYRWLISSLGDSNEMSKLVNDLTKSIRQNQYSIDRSSKDLIRVPELNQKLTQFERLFLSENSKHLFIGSAFGLTNTVVSYPTLSNLLYNMTSNPPTEIIDAIKYHWLNLQKRIRLMNKTLNGINSLLTK